ncbi:hypothetical protein [Paenibacillus sp. MMO-177]|uniref:hypothetical protein n=1 Tax=Paenibacillus sp. MMO-177 TaxID=3081289 RepID=UPI00301AB70C
MKRLLLICDDKDFVEWIDAEISTETGRFIRTLDSLDFFIPQWRAAGGADYIIMPETVVHSDQDLLKAYKAAKEEYPETTLLLIYYRESDELIKKLEEEGNICLSYNDLDTGVLDELIRTKKNLSIRPAFDEVHIQNSQVEQPIKAAEIQGRVDQSVVIAAEDNLEVTDSPKKDESTSSGTVSETDKLIPIEWCNSEEDISKGEHQKALTIDSESNKQSIPIDTPNYEDSVPKNKEIKEQQILKKSRTTASEQQEKLARIKERIIIEKKIVKVHVPIHFNSKLVSVVSLYPRAGATFVTANFARMLGENKIPVAVLEPVFGDRGSTYYDLMHGEKNAPKDWVSWADQIKRYGTVKQEKSWSSSGVTWITSSIEPIDNWTEEQNMMLLLAANRFPITLCDISSRYDDPHCKKIINMSDEIWVVADGDPLQLSFHYRTIDQLKQIYEGKTIRVIGNRWNKHINNSEWKEAVLLPVLSFVPELGTVVIKHLWNGKMAWDDAKLKNNLASSFKTMARLIIAKEMYQIIRKQYGIGAKLKAIFKQIKSLEDEKQLETTSRSER